MKMNKMKHERIKINNTMKTKQNNQIKKNKIVHNSKGRGVAL